MENGFFLITGTSQGIGQALARNILEKGHTVLGVSRTRPDAPRSEKYHHIAFDLTETAQLNRIIDKMNEIIDGKTFDFVCLVNNAAATEPVGSIEKCPPGDIDAHVKIGMIAPMILTSLFIQRFSGEGIRKKAVFISSGAAFNTIVGESTYCSTKAGINMFARCVGAEQQDVEGGFEVHSIGPGMVDTPMQKAIRTKPSDEFAMANFFNQAYMDGKLQDPGIVAEKIFTILVNKFEQGKYVSVNDV